MRTALTEADRYVLENLTATREQLARCADG